MTLLRVEDNLFDSTQPTTITFSFNLSATWLEDI